MEAPEIITKALQKSSISSVNEELAAILKKLENYSPQDFLNGEKIPAMRAVDNEIRDLVQHSLYCHCKDDSAIDRVASIIFTAKSYLQEGILNADVKAILIFLSINCYLQLETEKLLSTSPGNTDNIAAKIVELLLQINLTVQPQPDARYHEKKVMDEATDGFANNDITRTYRLIEGIERGGRGFHFNSLVEYLMSFLYQIDFNNFLTALLLQESPTSFVFYLQNFRRPELLKIAQEPSLTNRWLNFEIIRQIVEKEREDGVGQLEAEAITTVLERVQITDFDFFKQTVRYFNVSSLFNAALGDLLASMNNPQIEEVIATCFSIERYDNRLKARDALKEQFTKSVTSEEQYDFLMTVAFKKWKAYFNEITGADNFFQSGILLTDFANFVIAYHSRLTDDSTLIEKMGELMGKIEFIDSEWSISESQQLTKYHLYLSELYLLTFAYRNKELSDGAIEASYHKLCTNAIQISRYIKDETKEQLEKARQNIEWRGIV